MCQQHYCLVYLKAQLPNCARAERLPLPLLALTIRLCWPQVNVYAPQQSVPHDDAVYLLSGGLVLRLSRLLVGVWVVGELGQTFQFENAAQARSLLRDLNQSITSQT